MNVASKILERLVSLQLRAYLDDCCALSDEQFGFRPHHSVDHALVTLTESIRSSIDNGSICILVSLDLSKAFDSVNHTILLKNSVIMASITRGSKVTFLEEHNLFEVVTILQAISCQVCHRVVF